MVVMEFSGADKDSPILAEITGPQGMLSAWNSKPFDAAAGSAALLGIVTANGGAYSAGDGFKIEDSYITPNSAKFSFAVLDRFFTSAQTGITGGVTWNGMLQATASGDRHQTGRELKSLSQVLSYERHIAPCLLYTRFWAGVRRFKHQPPLIAAGLDGRQRLLPFDQSGFLHKLVAVL